MPVKLFSNARCRAAKQQLNREPLSARAAASFSKTTSMIEKCIAAARSVRKNKAFPSNNVAFAVIGSTAQPAAKKCRPTPF